MMPLEPVVLSFGAVFLLGLGFGSGPCNVVCLPYLGPVFVATGNGIRNAWRILLPFSAGRLTGYALLGTFSGFLGLIVQDWVTSPWVHWVLGLSTMMVALSLIWRRRKGRSSCSSNRGHAHSVEVAPPLPDGVEPVLPSGLFLMGAGMALNPCAPLTTVMLAAATTGHATAGMVLGAGFGMGAVVVPTLIFSLGVAHFGQQLRLHMSRWSNTLENVSVVLLLMMGLGTAMGWVVP